MNQVTRRDFLAGAAGAAAVARLAGGAAAAEGVDVDAFISGVRAARVFGGAAPRAPRSGCSRGTPRQA